MFQYYILEIKKVAGEYEHHVYWEWDEIDYKARRKAESKGYELLAQAAVSGAEVHSVTVQSDAGEQVLKGVYYGVAEPEPEEAE